MFGNFLSGLGSAFGTAGGNLLGALASSGLQYYLNKDLMGYANNLNRENLREGPSIQREGLEAAGYNPLLALSGYTSGLPSVSPMSVGQSDLSNLGTSAMNAYKMKVDSDLSKQQKEVARTEVDVKKAQAQDLGASKQLKDALKDKAEADATKTKVETFTEPARVVSSVLGAGATAYGAKKAVEALKASKASKASPKVINLLGKSKMSGSFVGASKSLLRYSPFALAPIVFGSASARSTKSVMDSARREGHWIDKHGIERNPKWIYGGVPILP